jgi:hypothetical protein
MISYLKEKMKLTKESFAKPDVTSQGKLLRTYVLSEFPRSKEQTDIYNALILLLFPIALLTLVLFAIFSLNYGYPLIFIASWVLPIFFVRLPLRILSKGKEWSWFDWQTNKTRNDLIFDVLFCLTIATFTRSIVLSVIYIFITLISLAATSLSYQKVPNEYIETIIESEEEND